MFLILCSLLIAAEAAKLDNTYLPPTGAKESGGSDGDLQVPLEPPYIDQYSPQHHHKTRPYRPTTRGLGLGGKPIKPSNDGQILENEDEIVVPTPMLGQGRFISGSYSYTGPDNVLVTVTYKADETKGLKDDFTEEGEGGDDGSNYEQPQEEAEEEEEVRSAVEEEDVQEDESEDSVVPTPPSLPAELARAFDFHKRKQQREEEKTHQKPSKNKKPLHGLHGFNKKKGSQSNTGYHQQTNAGNFGMKLNPSQGNHQGGYHYAPQSNYVPPTINQGYSYAKHN